MSSAVGARGSDAGQGGLGLQTVDVGGVSISVEQRDLSVEDFDECVDPCFFEQDYTVAASTGFHVWEGCWILVSELQGGTLSDVVRGRRVLELGAGTGLGGLCCAAVGAHVLLTDVPSVVWGVLAQNVARNATKSHVSGPEPPSSVATASTDTVSTSVGRHDSEAHGAATPATPWPTSVPVGQGSAAVAPLDWTVPVAPTGSIDPFDVDIIVAAECIWLVELVDPFVTTVATLLGSPRRPWCLLCFRERANDTSSTFVRVDVVIQAFVDHGCTVGPLSEHVVAPGHDRGETNNREKRVIMYRVDLAT
eukprot:m.175114 g.175114  ORF g.175114 m.175114 type:complete len:307 (-) comp13939_c0_seq1:89-1009(-)